MQPLVDPDNGHVPAQPGGPGGDLLHVQDGVDGPQALVPTPGEVGRGRCQHQDRYVDSRPAATR